MPEIQLRYSFDANICPKHYRSTDFSTNSVDKERDHVVRVFHIIHLRIIVHKALINMLISPWVICPSVTRKADRSSQTACRIDV